MVLRVEGNGCRLAWYANALYRVVAAHTIRLTSECKFHESYPIIIARASSFGRFEKAAASQQPGRGGAAPDLLRAGPQALGLHK